MIAGSAERTRTRFVAGGRGRTFAAADVTEVGVGLDFVSAPLEPRQGGIEGIDQPYSSGLGKQLVRDAGEVRSSRTALVAATTTSTLRCAPVTATQAVRSIRSL